MAGDPRKEVRKALTGLMSVVEKLYKTSFKGMDEEEWEQVRKSGRKGTNKSMQIAHKTLIKAAKKAEKQVAAALKDCDEMPPEIRKDIESALRNIPKLTKKRLFFRMDAIVKKKTIWFDFKFPK
ncbi:MAG: hypothetical protein AB3N15_10510 [Paracoccaceae bacterium]